MSKVKDQSDVPGLTRPRILQKVEMLKELSPEAFAELELLLDKGWLAEHISRRLEDFGVLLSELEVARYAAWQDKLKRKRQGGRAKPGGKDAGENAGPVGGERT